MIPMLPFVNIPVIRMYYQKNGSFRSKTYLRGSPPSLQIVLECYSDYVANTGKNSWQTTDYVNRIYLVPNCVVCCCP